MKGKLTLNKDLKIYVFPKVERMAERKDGKWMLDGKEVFTRKCVSYEDKLPIRPEQYDYIIKNNLIGREVEIIRWQNEIQTFKEGAASEIKYNHASIVIPTGWAEVEWSFREHFGHFDMSDTSDYFKWLMEKYHSPERK